MLGPQEFYLNKCIDNPVLVDENGCGNFVRSPH